MDTFSRQETREWNEWREPQREWRKRGVSDSTGSPTRDASCPQKTSSSRKEVLNERGEDITNNDRKNSINEEGGKEGRSSWNERGGWMLSHRLPLFYLLSWILYENEKSLSVSIKDRKTVQSKKTDFDWQLKFSAVQLLLLFTQM